MSATENQSPESITFTMRLRRVTRRILRRRPTTLESPTRDSTAQEIAIIEASGLFDAQWYVRRYPDVASSGMDPVQHYVRHGAAEGRDPNAQFSTLFYLRKNPDVAAHGFNPFRHYVQYGRKEGRAANASTGDQAVSGPLVSIVIPVYGVEKYIRECLDSVVKQSYRNIEIIVVDDGSPDHSYEIARDFAKADNRIKLLRRENGGQGAARNTGVAISRGKYITFADPDDTLPPGAIARLVASLQESGSDFVVGAMRRIRHGNLIPPADWVKEVHGQDRFGITLTDFPDILKNVFVWNKLFNAEFYRREVGPFPEGMFYEDQEPTARAFLHGVFDVLTDTVYHWRIRDDKTSTTQRKTDPNDLRDRLRAKHNVARILSQADSSTYGVWLAKALGFDLRPYFEQIPRTDLSYFDQLRGTMLTLADGMTQELWQQVRIIDRLPALAVLEGYREDVGIAVARREEYGYFVPSLIKDGNAYLDRKYLQGMQLSPSDELLKLGKSDVSVVASVTSIQWCGTRLHLAGYAYLTCIESGDDFHVAVELVSGTQQVVELEVHSQEFPRADRQSKDSWNSHLKSGFSVDIDPDALHLDADTAWYIKVTVSCNRLDEQYSAPLRSVDTRSVPCTPTLSAVSGRSRWKVGLEPTGLSLQCMAVQDTLVTDVHTERGTVTITTEHSRGATLLLACATLGKKIEVAGTRSGLHGTAYRFGLPELRKGDNREHTWQMQLVGPDGPESLVYPRDGDDLEQASPQYRRVRVTADSRGVLTVLQSSWAAVVSDVCVGPATLVIRGRFDAPGASAPLARLLGDTQALQTAPVRIDAVNQKFEIRVPFDSDPAASGLASESELLLRPVAQSGSERTPVMELTPPRELVRPTLLHGFSVRLSLAVKGDRSERWLRASTHLQRAFPMDLDARNYGVTFSRTSRAALWVRFRAPYREDERGPLAQHRLRVWSRQSQMSGSGVAPKLEDAILFESFGGKQVSDSVLAICNEVIRRDMGLDLYWTVADMNMEVPTGTTPLLVHSRAWMHKLHHARYLVNNNNFPSYFRKSEGQVYVQTWHGTPLKRIGNDIPKTGLSIMYRQLMQRESDYWDVLLAQNDYAAEILPRAFEYGGKVLNSGYPRNDALSGRQAELRRIQVRNKFGFEPYHFVVLYAPTWRDNLSGANGYRRVNYLDFARVRRTLGEHARLVLRGHHNTAKDITAPQAGILDATHYPDINDLLLAADLLITDYSSVMFDYVVTGKPIVFLTPDIDQYRDETRGFYIDFEDVAPGPICRTNDELSDALVHLGGVVETYSGRYRGFRTTFAPHDDGAAAARVVDAVWSHGAGSHNH